MTTRTSAEFSAPTRGSRIRFELIIASVWLAFGLFVVPALVYWVGVSLLGPYGDAPSAKADLSAFYGAYFADLASLKARAWVLALGPLLLMSLVRALFIGVGSRTTAQHATDEDEDEDAGQRHRPAPPVESRRVEPRIGG